MPRRQVVLHRSMRLEHVEQFERGKPAGKLTSNGCRAPTFLGIISRRDDKGEKGEYQNGG